MPVVAVSRLVPALLPRPRQGARPQGLTRSDSRSATMFNTRPWGEGVIILIEGQGEKAEAVVRFPSVGEKRVVAVVDTT